jgi:hypothetical protein
MGRILKINLISPVSNFESPHVCTTVLFIGQFLSSEGKEM